MGGHLRLQDGTVPARTAGVAPLQTRWNLLLSGCSYLPQLAALCNDADGLVGSLPQDSIALRQAACPSALPFALGYQCRASMPELYCSNSSRLAWSVPQLSLEHLHALRDPACVSESLYAEVANHSFPDKTRTLYLHRLTSSFQSP